MFSTQWREQKKHATIWNGKNKMTRSWNSSHSALAQALVALGVPAAQIGLYKGVDRDSWTAAHDPMHEGEPDKSLYQWLLAHQR